MKKNRKRKVAIGVAATLIFSTAFQFGMVIPTQVVQAEKADPTTVELVAVSQNGVINALQGATVSFNIKLALANSANVNGKAFVYTNYSIDATGKASYDSSKQSSYQTFGTDSMIFNVSVAIAEGCSVGDVNVPIIVKVTNMGSGYVQVVDDDKTSDYFTVHVTPKDKTAPVVTITSPVNNGYYNASTLPALPVYSVVEANGHTEQVTGWDTSEGIHTVTVTSTDASENVGSASATYTIDNTAPTISTEIVDGGIYNAATLQNIGTYYSAKDTNLASVTGTQLNYAEGSYKATVTGTDKAGNSTTKTINYTVDNTKPAITFKFKDGDFYQSSVLGALNPYYNVEDEHANSKADIAPALDLSEGSRSVTVSATDLAGNSSSASAKYTVDDTAPTVTLKLEQGKYYNEAALTALGQYYSASDTNLFKVDVSTLTMDVDGTHTATVTATDMAGNKTTESVDYNVDNTNPAVTFSELLKNGGFYQSSKLKDIKDSFYAVEEVNKAQVYVYENNELIDELDLSDGQHSISVIAVDAAGNTTTESITYTIDDVAPTVSFCFEDGSFLTSEILIKALNSDGTYYTTSDNNGVVSVVFDELDFTEGTHTLNVAATDAAGNSTKESITYTIDNTPPTVSFLIANGSFLTSEDLVKALNSDGSYYTASDNNAVADVKFDPLQASEGKYTLNVTATDAAGNSITESVTYTVDNTAPEVSFNIPDGSFLTSAKLTEVLNGKEKYYNASDNFKLENVEAPDLEISEGPHTLGVTAVDAAGNYTTKSVTYTIDNTAPTITVKIVDDGIYNEDTLKEMGVYYLAEDANLYSVSASSLDYTEGNHTATITAADKAGNSKTKTINYTVDNTAPSISFNFNDKGFYQSKVLKEMNPYYNVSDEHLDEVSIKASVLDLSEGEHSVTVSVSDKAGNSNSATSSYTVDDTAPVVTINLDPMKYYNAAALSALGDYYTATDTNLSKVEASTLTTDTDGTYTAIVSATDKAGNSTTKSVDYNVDNTKPVVTFNALLKNGGFYQSSALESIKDSFFTASDDHLDNSRVSAVENDSPISKLNLYEGTHIVTVTAVDKAGNSTTGTITYIVDNTKPVVSFTGLKDGQRFIVGQKVTVNWTASDTNLESLLGGSITLITETAGEKTVTIPAATDKAGNVTPEQIIKYYVYNFSGVLQPINADGKSSFKLGSTIPVKFKLFNGSKYLTDARVTIELKAISGAALTAPVNEVVSTSAATEGSLFRYDSTDNQYIFNLSTKNLKEGQYKALINIMVDGETETKESVVFTIKR